VALLPGDQNLPYTQGGREKPSLPHPTDEVPPEKEAREVSPATRKRGVFSRPITPCPNFKLSPLLPQYKNVVYIFFPTGTPVSSFSLYPDQSYYSFCLSAAKALPYEATEEKKKEIAHIICPSG